MKTVPCECKFNVFEIPFDHPIVHKGNDVIMVSNDEESQPEVSPVA